MSAWRRFKTFVIAVVAFLAGHVAWAALLGALAGVADSAGVVLSETMWMAPGPVVGLLAAGYVAGVFD
jgi:hypothetical protein